MKSRHLQEPALRYFLEVVRCGSITEASKRLNVAISAISRQIARLEDLLGMVLFERRPRGRFIPALAEQRTRIDESLVDVCVSSRGGVPQKGDVGGDAHLNQQHEQLTESRQPRSGVAGDPPA